MRSCRSRMTHPTISAMHSSPRTSVLVRQPLRFGVEGEREVVGSVIDFPQGLGRARLRLLWSGTPRDTCARVRRRLAIILTRGSVGRAARRRLSQPAGGATPTQLNPIGQAGVSAVNFFVGAGDIPG